MPHNNDDARIIVPSSQSLVSMNRLIHRNNPIVDLILILEVCSVYMQRNYLRQITLETLGISFLSFQSLLEKLLSTSLILQKCLCILHTMFAPCITKISAN